MPALVKKGENKKYYYGFSHCSLQLPFNCISHKAEGHQPFSITLLQRVYRFNTRM